VAKKTNRSLRLICRCSLPDSVLYVKFYVIDFLPMLNFLTDPLIYGIRMREIRRAYRRMLVAALPCGWCRARLLTEQNHMSPGMTEYNAGFSLGAVTTRIDARSSAPMRLTERNLLETELSLHDE